MAEHTSNDKEHDSRYILDKENQPYPQEQNETRQALMIQNPQENQKAISTLGIKKPLPIPAKGGARSKATGENQKTRSTPVKKRQSTGKEKGGARSKLTGEDHQSNLRQLTIKDAFKLKETSNNQKTTESTVETAEPTEKRPCSGSSGHYTNASNTLDEKVKNESTATEKKGSICVSYVWENEANERNTTDLQTPIIEFAKANSSRNKKSGYLVIYARNIDAIVNPWVPCGALQQSEVLELSIKKMKFSSKQNIVPPKKYKYPIFDDGIFFKVRYQGKTNGGKPVKIINERQYYNKHKCMAVFGSPHETIHQAFQNDKRFGIRSQFRLEDSSCTRHNSDMSLSDLNSADTYTIVVQNSEQETLASKDLQNNEGSTSSVPGTSVPQSEPHAIPCHQPKAVSSRVSSKFTFEFKKLAKTIGEEKLKSELEDDFRHNVLYKVPMMATTFRLLNKHLDNVALLRYDVGGVKGSGTLFLLTPSLGVTCYHVVKLFIKSRAVSNVEVIFNYESEENVVRGTYKGVAWADNKLDCAFVCVEISPTPPGLLNYIAPPPQDGAVSIIGHPNTEHKQIDVNCSVIDYHKRAESILSTILSDRSFIHVLTKYSFMPMSDETFMTYDSCLYEGASGSPVFNHCGDLVAVHTGGYLVNTPLKKKSVIEYGRSAVEIVIHGAIHLEKVRDAFRKLVEGKINLLRYLQPGGHPVKMQPIIRQLLQLWGESDSQMQPIRQLLQLWEESDSQLEQNPGVHPSNGFNDVPDSPMDTST